MPVQRSGNRHYYITDVWSAEFETARQFGRILDGNRQAAG